MIAQVQFISYLSLSPPPSLPAQIYHEARKFGKAYNLTVTCVYGGGSKWEQSKAVKEGCEILVATPGRLIDLVKIKATNLQRVTYLVFDEADRMFDMGFGEDSFPFHILKVVMWLIPMFPFQRLKCDLLLIMSDQIDKVSYKIAARYAL